MPEVLAGADAARLRERLPYLAWRQYRIPQGTAEDLVQAAMVTYLQVRHRYPETEEHPRILVGIFRNKCREHIHAQIREERQRQLLAKLAEASEGRIAAVSTDVKGDGVLEDLVRREDMGLIFEALSNLRPSAREMLRMIVEDGATRQDLIRHYGLNKNTLDSRLRAARQEVRAMLREKGVEP
jgi:RNA polymerase sigma factor (sigma-70 family)